jgi:SET domain
MFKSSIVQSILPSILKALDSSKGYEDLEAIYTDSKSTTVFDYDLRDLENPETKRNLLKCTASLKGREKDDTFISNILLSVCEQFNEIIPENIPKTSAEILRHFFNRHTLIGASNVMGSPAGGRAYLAFSSLLNHSCDPNIQLTWFDSKATLVTNRPVRAGGQLFIAYKSVAQKSQTYKFMTLFTF